MKPDIARTSSFRCLCPHRQHYREIVVCEDKDNGDVRKGQPALASTHPDITTLVDPLFVARKEGNPQHPKIVVCEDTDNGSRYPLFAARKEGEKCIC